MCNWLIPLVLLSVFFNPSSFSPISFKSSPAFNLIARLWICLTELFWKALYISYFYSVKKIFTFIYNHNIFLLFFFKYKINTVLIIISITFSFYLFFLFYQKEVNKHCSWKKSVLYAGSHWYRTSHSREKYIAHEGNIFYVNI